MKASLAGQLYSVSANVACRPMDKHGLPGGYLGIVEEHLPSGNSYNWSRRRLNKVQSFWLLRHHSGRRHRIFSISPGQLLVCCPVYFVASLETRDSRSDRFDDSRQLETKNKGQVFVG